jgi:ribosome-binding protein aMBF1 (putative translation factor)
MLASLLTACGKFECDFCGKEKSGKKHKEELMGKEVVICDECYKELEELADGLK